jgi:hypothetical protein
MAKGVLWTDAELEIVRLHQHLPFAELHAMLPGRSDKSVYQARVRARQDAGELERAEQPEVKEPGEYLETLNAYFAGHAECLEIWMRWNGYITYRELCRDMAASPLGTVTFLCEAK